MMNTSETKFHLHPEAALEMGDYRNSCGHWSRGQGFGIPGKGIIARNGELEWWPMEV
jgi:hypothetical protein